MSTYYKEAMLLQTFIELDTQICNLSRRISADRYLEVGDDPGLVQSIESILARVHRKVKAIAPYFDLSTISLKDANYYFDLVKQVDDALTYLQEVRRKDCGSRQHTRELLEKLENCSNSIFAISDHVSVKTEAEAVH